MKKESLQSIENQLFLSSIFQALPKFQNRFVVWLAAVILLLTFSTQNANAQKMLLIEKANRAKTTNSTSVKPCVFAWLARKIIGTPEG